MKNVFQYSPPPYLFVHPPPPPPLSTLPILANLHCFHLLQIIIIFPNFNFVWVDNLPAIRDRTVEFLVGTKYLNFPKNIRENNLHLGPEESKS